MRFLIAVFAALLWAPLAHAAYPEKIIHIYVSAIPGSVPDVVIRLIGPKLTELLGQEVVIESKAGANGTLAANEVARAAPDGYTFLATTAGTLTANPYLYPKTAAVAVSGLSPVTQIITSEFVVAAKSALNVKTLPELLDRLRKEPGKLTAASSSHGSFPHLGAEMLKQKAKLDFTIAKMNGEPAAASALGGGHVDFVIGSPSLLESLVQGNQVVFLASTGAKRDPRMADLPTVAESGVADYGLSGWIALAAPRETPLAVRETIQKAVAKALQDPTIRDRLAGLHFTPVGSTPQEFEALIMKEREQMRQVIKDAGLATE